MYSERPRRAEAFDWGADDNSDEKNSKVDVVIADLLRRKVGPAENDFSDYLKPSGSVKLTQLINQIDVTGNAKVEYSEYRSWIHCHYPSLCR
jgi:hypothetical protein